MGGVRVVEAAETAALFASWRSGDDRARARLFEIFYPELNRAAAGMLRRERNVSLSAGDLVHETVLRLIQLRRIEIEDRAHFMALASRFMRRTLVDHVRAKQTDKRGHQRVTLVTGVAGDRPLDLSGLDHALIRLGSMGGQRADIVEMRYFGGMSVGDIAAVLSLSEATVKRRWMAARAWLVDAMEDPFVPVRSDA
jgi:RNA polymerase sigma factor (TIGR02999 family)